MNGGRFSPLLYPPKWILPFAKTLGAFAKTKIPSSVAELGSGSYGPEPFSLAYVSPGKRTGSSIGLSSQELHFHLRVLNMNKKPIEYLK